MFENITHQYRIIAGRAGWCDRASNGVIRVDGPDRLTFLHALVTNDTMKLGSGLGVAAAYLTPQGRMITALEVLNRGAYALLLVAPGTAAPLAKRLDSLIFAEQVTVADASKEWRELAVTGAEATGVVAEVFGVDRHELEALAELQQLECPAGFVFRGGESPLPLFRVLLPPPELQRAIEALQSLGIPAVPAELETAFRIEAARGAWGVDLFEDTIPLEGGLLERAISTTKGCYVGQEVVIRILHRGGGRVAKRLVQLALDPNVHDVPAAGAPLLYAADITGRVTSAAFSPARNAIVALGYVHRDVAEIGKTVGVGTAGATASVIGMAG